jgi:ketosteroid isomerase-like protein
MQIADVQKWLDEYGRAWTGGNADAAVALFRADATYQETPFDEPMKGRDEIRAYWQSATDEQKNVSFKSKVWAVAGNEAYAWWHATFKRAGEDVELDGVFRLVFAAEGGHLACTALQEWWHARDDDA